MIRLSHRVSRHEDRRIGRRRRSFETVWITATGFGTARCTMVNLSEDGARIAGPVGLRVGDRATITLKRGVKRRCRVMWVEADIIGLSFTSD